MNIKYSNWLKLVIITLSLIGFLVFVNCYIDPANLFHSVSIDIADSVLEGNPTYITSGNMNERVIKQRMIENMPDEVECITVGPSIVFGIRKEHVDTESYYNLGVSGADFYDILAQFGMMELNGKSVERVVFCVDSYFFDAKLYESFTRNIPFKSYAEYMMKILDGEAPHEIPQNDTRAESVERIRQMFSISYFQSAVEYARTKGTLNISRWGIADETYDGTYYLADGSLWYAESNRNTTVDTVVNDAKNIDINYYYSINEHISTKSMEVFEKLVLYLQAKGTQVDLFLCPICPTLWDRLDENQYPMLWDIEAFANEMAEKYSLKITGSYNPYTLAISDFEYYDSRHVRHEMIEEYFDFK